MTIWFKRSDNFFKNLVDSAEASFSGLSAGRPANKVNHIIYIDHIIYFSITHK